MTDKSIIETVIQGAVVDLFRSLDIAVAPAPPLTGKQLREFPDLAAFVKFNSDAGSGTVCLGCPMGVLQLAEGTGDNPLAKEDWIRELMNQLMGGVKKRFLQFGVSLEVSLPSPASRQFIEQHGGGSHTGRVFPFRTMRGSVVLILDAVIDVRQFAYAGGVEVHDEGEIILF